MAEEEEPFGLLTEMSQRTGQLYGALRWLAIGPRSLIFWSCLLAAAVIGLLVVRGGARTAPAAVVNPPGAMVKCIAGQMRVRVGRFKWKRFRRLPAGQAGLASVGRLVLAFGDDSTLRLRKGSMVSWQRLTDGRFAFTLQRGRAWFCLSPLDAVLVNFPQGRLQCAAGSIVEVTIHDRGRAKSAIRCRRGDVKARVRVGLRKGTGTPVPRTPGAASVPRYRTRALTLQEGQLLLLMKPSGTRLVTHPNPDDRWQHWNGLWNKPSDSARLQP